MVKDVWRNFINKPKLTCDFKKNGEICFSHYGPTFSITAAFSSSSSVVLIHNVCVEISLKNKKNSFFLDWFSFRPASYTPGNFSGVNFMPVTKFTVAPNHPNELNIVFSDTNRFAEMKPVLSAIKDTWKDSLKIAREKDIANMSAIFEEFKGLKIISSALGRLQIMNYWEPGNYDAKIRVTTENPRQYFDTTINFIISETEAKTLSDNIPAIIGNICHQPQINYSSALPTFVIKN